jgi:hypothetical protein
MKKIFYKNYLGQWVEDKGHKVSQRRLKWIKKNKAENGVATIQDV